VDPTFDSETASPDRRKTEYVDDADNKLTFVNRLRWSCPVLFVYIRRFYS